METKKDYKTLHAFEGCDFVIFLDNKVISELDDIVIDTKKNEIELRTTLFSSLKMKHKELIKKEDSKMLVVFSNEYGEKMYRTFNGISFSHEKIAYSIRNTKMYNAYIFNFKDASSYEDFSTVDELRKDVFDV